MMWPLLERANGKGRAKVVRTAWCIGKALYLQGFRKFGFEFLSVPFAELDQPLHQMVRSALLMVLCLTRERVCRADAAAGGDLAVERVEFVGRLQQPFAKLRHRYTRLGGNYQSGDA